MIGCPEYTLSLPPPCPTNRDHLNLGHVGVCQAVGFGRGLKPFRPKRRIVLL